MLTAAILVIATLVACAPRGYYRDNPDIMYMQNGKAILAQRPNIVSQFPELNSYEHYQKDDYYFSKNDHLYTIIFRRTNPGSGNRVEATVFRDLDKQNKIGRFIEITKQWQTPQQYASYGLPFLLDSNLYYHLGRAKEGFYLSHNMTALYFSNEYYRFNLDTGANEKITLTQYVEALQQIDINWIINPKYKGER